MKTLDQVITSLHTQDQSPDSYLFAGLEIQNDDVECTKEEAEKIKTDQYNLLVQYDEFIDIDSPKFNRAKMEEYEAKRKELPKGAYMAGGKYFIEK